MEVVCVCWFVFEVDCWLVMKGTLLYSVLRCVCKVVVV